MLSLIEKKRCDFAFVVQGRYYHRSQELLRKLGAQRAAGI